MTDYVDHFYFVLGRGLEPPRPKALVPKTNVSTNFTTPALKDGIYRTMNIDKNTEYA